METIKSLLIYGFLTAFFVSLCLFFIWLFVTQNRCEEVCKKYQGTVSECGVRIVECKMKDDCTKSFSVRKE